MKIRFVQVGKTFQDFVVAGCQSYRKRLLNYLPYEEVVIPALKNARGISSEKFKAYEGEQILKKLDPRDYVVLLDERGVSYTSEGFADFVQQQMNSGIKNLCFVVGGAYGFSPGVYSRAQAQISLSPMTFSHQLIRLIFLEQLYRAMTILRNEPYHNA
ncbi:MAG: 23S rRNA (pseudouridine(1915)-N(3))-methyltransferase RlmH [Bacteroidales bacterium]|nr:23S rRNA (pseudouridine(1915)-N(3))-methyltransferase RlmH [Bacteroidales bacterium]NLO49948.1 23S rRNA (pseudouridine(1915)-N(3))-methyltransferase RlmH [Bacteroidales bacterium]